MERVLSESDKQSLVSAFLEIAVDQTADTAMQFLQATSWSLDEAFQLYFVGTEAGLFAPISESPPVENVDSGVDQNAGELESVNNNVGPSNGDEVRAPLPVLRETLNDDAMLYAESIIGARDLYEQIRSPGVWESDQGASSGADAPQDNLASLYRPPYHLMFLGSFAKAKDTAAAVDKWLLVNLQSSKEFSSHMLNRDTWGNEAVSQTISTNFIFWQVYDDAGEGRKVCTYYKLDSLPAVLVIDPMTGQKMRSWCGMVQPDSLLEDLIQFMDGGPKAALYHKRTRGSSVTSQQKIQVSTDETNEDEEMLRAVAASMENLSGSVNTSSDDNVLSATDEEEPFLTKKLTYPPLPEEPKGDKNLMCRIGVRLPDGLRAQRNFLRSDPIQLLWSFCYSQLGEAESKPFRLTQPIPGASRSLDYDSKLTFAESGLANSMISVTWE